MIEHENQRLNSRMSTNGAYVNSHNDYVAHRYGFSFLLVINFLYSIDL